MLSNIFSVKEYNCTHNLMKIFGIKIKFPKLSVLRIYKKLPYFSYVKNNIDITTIPPAEGQFRDIQLANLALLIELDYVCKLNNLKYWLDFGTLLGAVRHRGFIPWDDDIDVGMLRSDYNKLIEVFNSTTRDTDFFASYSQCSNSNQYIIKIQHKKCSHLFVDVFPYDSYGKRLSLKEQLELTNDIKNIRKSIDLECSKNIKVDLLLDVVKEKTEKFVLESVDDFSDLFWGLDYSHHWKNWFANHDVIFPLKEVIFEGIKLSCVNDYDAYLTKVYGDYMKYPKKFGFGHNMFAEFDENEKDLINSLRYRVENSFDVRNV